MKAIIEIIMTDVTIMGSNVFDVRVGDIGHTSVRVPLKQKPGGQEHLQPAHHDTQPGRGEPGTLVSVNTPASDPRYHNPSSVVQLISCANEAAVVIKGGDDGTGGY